MASASSIASGRATTTTRCTSPGTQRSRRPGWAGLPWPPLEPLRADLPAGALAPPLGKAVAGGAAGGAAAGSVAGAAAGRRVPPCTLPRTPGSVFGSGSAALPPAGARCAGSGGSSEREARPDAGDAGATRLLGGARDAKGARCAAADAESSDRGICCTGLCRPLPAARAGLGRAGLGTPSSNSSTAHSDVELASFWSTPACASPTPLVLSGSAAGDMDRGESSDRGEGSVPRPLIFPSGARPFSSSQKGFDF